MTSGTIRRKRNTRIDRRGRIVRGEEEKKSTRKFLAEIPDNENLINCSIISYRSYLRNCVTFHIYYFAIRIII